MTETDRHLTNTSMKEVFMCSNCFHMPEPTQRSKRHPSHLRADTVGREVIAKRGRESILWLKSIIGSLARREPRSDPPLNVFSVLEIRFSPVPKKIVGQRIILKF